MYAWMTYDFICRLVGLHTGGCIYVQFYKGFDIHWMEEKKIGIPVGNNHVWKN